MLTPSAGSPNDGVKSRPTHRGIEHISFCPSSPRRRAGPPGETPGGDAPSHRLALQRVGGAQRRALLV